MAKLKVLSYEWCRKDYFVHLRERLQNQLKYWSSPKRIDCETAYDKCCVLGRQIQYLDDVIKMLDDMSGGADIDKT